MSKKGKIRKYLHDIDLSHYTDFEKVLLDYVNGNIKKYLKEIGLRINEIYVDWFEEIKTLSIQSKFDKYFVRIQIDKNDILIGHDIDEVDEYNETKITDRDSSIDVYDFINYKLRNALYNTCKCCGYKTLGSKGMYEICPICFWEDDPFIDEGEDNANHMTLEEGQKNYIKYGSSKESFLQYVRKPTEKDIKDENWNPIV